MNIRFVSADSRKEIQTTVGFLAKQSLGYPRYNDWVGRAEAELHTGYKRAILAFSEDCLVGNLVWQPHKTIQGAVEWKNLRVHPAVKRRLFGRFIIRQAEEICGFPAAICDVRTDQQDTIRFLLICGYTTAATLPLYDSEKPDTVMVKWLRPPTQDLKTAFTSAASKSLFDAKYSIRRD